MNFDIERFSVNIDRWVNEVNNHWLNWLNLIDSIELDNVLPFSRWITLLWGLRPIILCVVGMLVMIEISRTIYNRLSNVQLYKANIGVAELTNALSPFKSIDQAMRYVSNYECWPELEVRTNPTDCEISVSDYNKAIW